MAAGEKACTAIKAVRWLCVWWQYCWGSM